MCYWPDLLPKVGKAWASGQICGQFCGHFCPTWGEFCPHKFFRSGHLSTKNEDTCRNPDLSDLGQCPQTQSKEKASVEATLPLLQDNDGLGIVHSEYSLGAVFSNREELGGFVACKFGRP